MIPSDLGLPPKFTAFRRGQFDAALDAATAEVRFVMLSSPTGSGKSVIYMTAAQLLDARTLILTGTKGLQQQLLADFAPIGLTDIRGQNNYRCAATDKDGPLSAYAGSSPLSCDEGPCHVGVYCPLRRDPVTGESGGCPYDLAVDEARRARLVVTNYAYWMTTGRYANPDALGQFDLIVLDEAHAAPDELADFCSVSLDRDEVSALIHESLPPLDEGVDVWASWAMVALGKCKIKYAEAKREFEMIGSDKRKMGRLLRRLTTLGRELKELSTAHSWRRAEPADPNVTMPGMQTDWIAETTPTGARFSPVWAHAYAETYLFRSIPRVLLVSAVLQRATARYLGIEPAQMVFREFASTFDPKRRPLIYVPTTSVDRHMNEGQVRIWINKIDAIVGARMDRKGIIHTRSYERARLIMERSRHSAVMMSHTSRTTRQVVERFKRAQAPRVLVSPSIEEGYDFPMDQCRYQILAKVPFVDSRSALIRARMRSDKSYLNYLTALAIIQQVGRGMRAEDDVCESIIIDDHIRWFWRAAATMFPKWFKAAWRTEEGIPEPIRLGL